MSKIKTNILKENVEFGMLLLFTISWQHHDENIVGLNICQSHMHKSKSYGIKFHVKSCHMFIYIEKI